MPDISIIQSLTRIPVGLLTPRIDLAGPYSGGSVSLTTWNDGGTIRNVSDTFGVLLQINGAIAPRLGLQIGYDDGGTVVVDEFNSRIVQVVQLFQALSGAWLPVEVTDVHYLPFMLRWAEDLPGKIGLYVAPTWHVDMYYLVTI